MSGESGKRFIETQELPSCAKACATGAIKFGDRDELLAEAKARIIDNPRKYVNHIYGEREAGGTGILYMAGEPFKKLGFPKNIGTRPYPSYTHFAKAFIPHIVVSVGGLLAGLYWFHHRRNLIEALPSEKE